MNGLGAVFRKEFRRYFNSAVAYVFIVVFLGILAWLFSEHLFGSRRAEMRYYFDLLPWALCFFIPAITMSMWAEERRSGTIEFLLTLPIKLTALVLGKYLAALAFFLVALAGSVAIPATLLVAWKVDSGPILGSYFGAALLGAYFIGVGMAVSALSRDYIVAFILSLISCFMLMFLGFEFTSSSIDNFLPGVGTFIRIYLAFEGRLYNFERGIVDLRDVAYFVSMVALFIGLTVYLLAGQTRVQERSRFGVAGVLLAGIAIFLNLNLYDIRLGRTDLTSAKLYTLSPATGNILNALRSPVLVRYFVTPADKMPGDMHEVERDVTDILRELSAQSDKFTYRVEYPTKGSDAEKFLKDKGIKPRVETRIERDQAQQVLVYSAMVLTYLDKEEEKIDRIGSGDIGSLEFDLALRIHRMTLPRKPKVAVYTPMGKYPPQMRMQMRTQDPYQEAANALRDTRYDVVNAGLTASDSIPADADALIVFEPESLNERQLWEINRFLRQGRSVIIAAEQYKLSYSQSFEGLEAAIRAADTGLKPLLEPLGLLPTSEVLLDANHTTITLTQYMGPFPTNVEVPLPTNVIINGDTFNRETAIANGISLLIFLGGSPIAVDAEKAKRQGLETKVLATSSPRSWTVPSSKPFLSEVDVHVDRKEYGGAKPIIVLAEGTFPDLWAGKPVPAWPEGAKGADEKPIDTPSSSRLVVVSSAQVFDNNWIHAQGCSNRTLLLNLVDSLTHGSDLLQIRSKAFIPKVIGDIQPAQGIMYRILMIGAAPVLLIGFGILRLMRRRGARRLYFESLKP